MIVGNSDWKSRTPPPRAVGKVALRVGWREVELRQRVKAAGGKWDPAARVWRLRRDRAEELGLEDRIVDDPI